MFALNDAFALDKGATIYKCAYSFIENAFFAPKWGLQIMRDNDA